MCQVRHNQGRALGYLNINLLISTLLFTYFENLFNSFQTVKIITVPGQGVGGKPIRAAVIPMHLFQRGVKVLTSSGQQTIGPGGTVVSSSGVGSPVSAPRVLALRPATQITGQTSGNVTILSTSGAHIRPV